MELERLLPGGEFAWKTGHDHQDQPESIWAADPFVWRQYACEAPEYIRYSEFHSFRILKLGDLSATYRGESVVIRIKDMSSPGSRLIAIREWQRWRTLVHRNIIKLIGISVLPGQALAFIFPSLPSLSEFGRTKFDEIRAIQMAEQIANALQLIHSRRLIHGDITPASIVLASDGEAQLIGLGEDEDSGFARTCRLGSMEYAAPEVMNADLRGPCGFTCRVDIWSLGIVLSQLINGSLVWPIEPEDNFHQRLLTGMRPCLPSGLSKALRELIESCLTVQACRRPSAKSVAERLSQLIKWRKGNSVNAAVLRAQKGSCKRLERMVNQEHLIPGCQSNKQLVCLLSSQRSNRILSDQTGLNLEQTLLLQKILRILGCRMQKFSGMELKIRPEESRAKPKSETLASIEGDQIPAMILTNPAKGTNAKNTEDSSENSKQGNIEAVKIHYNASKSLSLTRMIQPMIVLALNFLSICFAVTAYLIHLPRAGRN